MSSFCYFFIFDKNGKCLLQLKQANKSKFFTQSSGDCMVAVSNDSCDEEYHQILYGLVHSLKAFIKRFNIPPYHNSQDDDYFYFRNSSYQLIYYESLTQIKFIIIIPLMRLTNEKNPIINYRKLIQEFYQKIHIKRFLRLNNQPKCDYESSEFRKELSMFMKEKLKIFK
ncbi:Trafficking protein particle complex subunit 1 [Dermatophagoides farinae]|uniref:Trafficking protein particle complex subunit 1 n=1 Tax=Dermatophagoides farinae TaxID=6954 RepID=A0A922IA15_DERFA|nr:hypothetical protein HUG17_4284 [Dermatophagoides farinae]KAH9526982.1 Trafficking protein particle complex subunit 1 [Dermatophagoides farinae]